jgi:hypothetical protein
MMPVPVSQKMSRSDVQSSPGGESPPCPLQEAGSPKLHPLRGYPGPGRLIFGLAAVLTRSPGYRNGETPNLSPCASGGSSCSGWGRHLARCGAALMCNPNVQPCPQELLAATQTSTFLKALPAACIDLTLILTLLLLGDHRRGVSTPSRPHPGP